MPESRLIDLLDAFPARRVAVIGDLIADEFIYGRVARVSREAPVLILQYDSTQILPGGAGNAANNVAALGGRTQIVGLTGKDEAGKRLHASLAHVNTRGLLSPQGYCTPVKTRILAGGVHTAKQQIVRIDRVVSSDYDAKSRAAFTRAALKAAADCDAILLSDYGTGLVTPELAAALSSKVDGRARRRAVPILIDSRYDLLKYRGLTACTPNESEVEQMLDTQNRRQPESARASRARAVEAHAHERGADHARQPWHGGVRAGSSDGSRADLRIGRSRRRDRRRRYRHRDDDARDCGRRFVRRSGAAGELRGRPRRDEAGNGDRVA